MMHIEESPARKAGKPITQPRHRANTRTARMIAACGLSHVEAAGFLGISKQAVAMKAAGLRPLFRDEEVKLIELWRSLQLPDVVDFLPLGAARMQYGLNEIKALSVEADRQDANAKNS